MLIRSVATALALVLAGPAVAQDAAPAQEEMAAPVPAADIVMGSEDAPLTVVEYASFTCGHCANFHNDNFPKLKAEYIDTGKVKFIQRDVYFDAIGLWAGILARCGGDDKYYAVSDLLLSEQRQWLSGGSGDEIASNLRKIGLKAGMTEDQMTACWDDKANAESLILAFQQNASADGIDSTPSFVIGGEMVPNQSWEDLRAIIERKLAEASGQ